MKTGGQTVDRVLAPLRPQGGIGILAEALGMALSKHGGGGALSDDQIERLGTAIGRAPAAHSHELVMDSRKVGEAVGRHQTRERMVRG